MLYYGTLADTEHTLLPLFLLLAVVTSLGVGCGSALNVEYRDVRYVVPFLTQFWMFATPIAYPAACCMNHGAQSMGESMLGSGRISLGAIGGQDGPVRSSLLPRSQH